MRRHRWRRTCWRWACLLLALLCCLGVGLFWSDRRGLWAEGLLPWAALLCLAGASAWLWRRRPPRLSLSETALIAERTFGLHQDLTAALEPISASGSAGVDDHGQSLALRQAVAEQADRIAAQLDWPRLHAIGPFPRTLLLWVAVSAATAVWTFAAEPGEARVFVARLLGARQDYPRRSTIDSLALGEFTEFFGQDSPLPPLVEVGRPIRLTVRVRGEPPAFVRATVTSPQGRSQSARLAEIDSADLLQRIAPLRQAAALLREAAQESADPDPSVWLQAAQRLEQELPQTARMLRWRGAASRDDGSMDAAARTIAQRVQWLSETRAGGGTDSADALFEILWEPAAAGAHRVLLQAGDSREVELPLLAASAPELLAEFQAADPGTPRSGEPPAAWTEGDRLSLRVRELHGRKLRELLIWTRGAEENSWTRQTIEPPGSNQETWVIAPPELNPLRRTTSVRLIAQTADGLWSRGPTELVCLATPDEPPTAQLTIAHEVVLPTAAPEIEYRIADDRGIAAARLLVEIETSQPAAENQGAVAGTAGPSSQRRRLPPLPLLNRDDQAADRRRLADRRVTPLAAWNLAAGDWVRFQLEVEDDCNVSPQIVRSPPVALRIGELDEVLREIQSADRDVESKLNALIEGHLQGGRPGETPP